MSNYLSTLDLSVTPFSEYELRKKYLISTFMEDSIEITFMREDIAEYKINSGNKYKFGEIVNNNFYWYNQGNPIAFSREEMRNVFSALNDLKNNSQKIIFTYKIKR